MPGTSEQQQAFVAYPKFAVVGASKDETKVGTKVRPIVSDPKWCMDLTVCV